MKLYYAHYPALEDRLVHFVRQNRTDRLDKWLVICASSWLARQLQTRLVRELGALANLHFITGSSLVGRLDAEAAGPTLPLLPQNHVRDFLIQEILTRPGLNRYPLSHGFVQAVKSALRDLSDSLVPAPVLLEHVQSMPDYVLEQDGGRFEWLVRVYQAYCEQENKIPGYRSYQNAFERALEQVEKSDYLHSFSHVIVYGFYDMPGRQLELFSRLRTCYPVTVFAPYEKHPAYSFAKKFFETNWLSAPGAEDANQPFSGALGASAAHLFTGAGSAPGAQVTVTSVPDVNGAVFGVAKQILQLLKQGASPSDIAVIVRNLPAYQDEIRRVFRANCLPLDSSFTYSFSSYALGRFILTLLGLAENGFSRENFLAVFSSPYFKQADKNAWRRLVQKSVVKRDLAQWKDLLPTQDPATPAVQAWAEQMARVLGGLQMPQPWDTGAACVWKFLQEQVDTDAFEGKDAEIFEAVEQTLLQLSVYQTWRAQSREGELVRQVKEALENLTFNEVENVLGGITLTDAMRARGLSFKYVFLLGLNDKEFPLITPEDPILRDYYRVQLRDTLGYWINASLDRADEEKLLFYNAVTAAKEQLFVSYARYGQDGKPAVPSVYAAELARVCELDLQAPDAPRISGRLSERLASCPTLFLTPQEVYSLGVLQPEAAENYRQAGILTPQVQRSLTAAQNLSSTSGLNAYDGVIANGTEIFKRENARGFSASALQEIGACPMKYFLNRALGLGEPEEPASRQELPADKRGSAYHEILKDFYQTLQAQGLTHTLFEQGAREYMEQSIAKFYTEDSYKRFGIYPVLWEMILENMRLKLTDFIAEDLKNLGTFTPEIFEYTAKAEPTEQLPFRLCGIIDRIDVDKERKQFFVADYKSTRKGSGKLSADIFTQLILQPFIYVILAQTLAQLKGYTSAGSGLLAISKYKKIELSTAEFEAVYDKVCGFLGRLTDLIKAGTFFISPSDLCTYCPYALLCRKDAFKPLLRARKSAAYKALEEARR